MSAKWCVQTFSGQGVGRTGTIEWPSRFPDLCPLDFVPIRSLETKIYVSQPTLTCYTLSTDSMQKGQSK